MTVDDMNGHLELFLRSCAELAKRKNRDYHPDNVAMLEILETSFETNVRPEQDLWGRLKKQLSALRRYIIDGHVESESPHQRMRDVANYMAIMDYWATSKVAVLNDAWKFVTNHRPCESTGAAYPSCLSQQHENRSADQPLCERCQFVNWLARQLLDASTETV